MLKLELYLIILIINAYFAQIEFLNHPPVKINPFFAKKIINNEKEKDNFKFLNNNIKNTVELIQGNLRKLGNKVDTNNNPENKLKYFIILLILILIIVVVLLIVIIYLMCKKKDYPSYQNISEESKKLTISHSNSAIEETNDTKGFSEVKVEDENKVTNEEVQFLRNIMKKTHK